MFSHSFDLVRMVLIRYEIFQHDTKCFNMVQNVLICTNCFKTVRNALIGYEMFQHDTKCFNMVQNVLIEYKMF